jgi:hypothetical protein
MARSRWRSWPTWRRVAVERPSGMPSRAQIRGELREDGETRVGGGPRAAGGEGEARPLAGADRDAGVPLAATLVEVAGGLPRHGPIPPFGGWCPSRSRGGAGSGGGMSRRTAAGGGLRASAVASRAKALSGEVDPPWRLPAHPYCSLGTEIRGSGSLSPALPEPPASQSARRRARAGARPPDPTGAPGVRYRGSGGGGASKAPASPPLDRSPAVLLDGRTQSGDLRADCGESVVAGPPSALAHTRQR